MRALRLLECLLNYQTTIPPLGRKEYFPKYWFEIKGYSGNFTQGHSGIIIVFFSSSPPRTHERI